jgi:hypothetical protein
MKKIILISFLLAVTQAQNIEIFSPEPNSQVTGEDVLVAVSFFGLDNIDPARIRLYIDGVDVSPRAVVDTDMLSYSPTLMAPGTHRVIVSAGRIDGGESYTREWAFTVTGEEKAPLEFTVNGKVTTTLDYDKIDDEELAVAGIGVNLQGSLSELLEFKTRIKLTSDEDPLLQPRNRFNLGFSLSRFLDVGIGDVNPRFTRLTLDGKRVRGLEANLKLGIINFHFIQGQLNRAVQGDPALDKAVQLTEVVQESDMNILHLNRLGYTFQQDITGGRLSFGRGERFQWGFNVMHVRDKKGSIQSNLNNALVSIPWDTLGLSQGTYTYAQLMAKNNESGYLVTLADQPDWAGKTPKDNLVIGTDIGFYFDEKRIAVESEIAFSMLNRNIWEGAISKDELDTLLDEDDDNKIFGKMSLDLIPFDPADFKNWFILNEYITPLAPIDVSVFSDSSDITYGEAILGMPSLALRTKLNLNYFGHYATVEFSQVGPEYNFLGNPYLLTNNRELTISDKIRLFQNRMMLTLIYKHQDDNIGTTVTNVTSQNTLTANVTLIPGPSLPTLNLSYKLIGRDNGIKQLDTLLNESTGIEFYSDNRENTQTTNIVASLNYSLDMWGMNHRINGTIVNVNKEDLFDYRNFDANFVDPRIATKVYNLSVTSRFAFPLKTTFALTTNSSEFSIRPLIMADSSRARQEFMNLKAEAEYGLFNRKLTVQGGVNYTTGAGQVEFQQIGIKGGTRIRLFKNFGASVLAEVRSKSTPEGNKNSVIGALSLSYNF